MTSILMTLMMAFDENIKTPKCTVNSLTQESWQQFYSLMSNKMKQLFFLLCMTLTRLHNYCIVAGPIICIFLIQLNLIEFIAF